MNYFSEDSLDTKKVIIEALDIVGHRHEDDGLNYDIWDEKGIKFSFAGVNYRTHFYTIYYNRVGEIRFDVGPFPKINLHEPNSVVLIQTIALQLPVIMALKEFANNISEGWN